MMDQGIIRIPTNEKKNREKILQMQPSTRASLAL